MIEYLTTNWDGILAIAMAVLGLASAIARVTPNKADNKAVDWVWKRINNLGLRGGE